MVTIDQLRAPSPDPWLNVFIDESGTNELDLLKQNVMRYFIVAAVFVDDDQAHSACTKLEQIALELCGGAEIMSKRIGSKHETRRRFLEAIQPIDFGYAALAVDKSLIATHPGLRYKRTFHKFFARMLQGRLTRYGGGLRVFSDEFGDSEFMRGFDAYLNENVPPNLFFEYEHEFVSSASSRLIQLADLIAGSISYWLEPGKRSESSEMFRELLRPKETDIVAWPLPRRPPYGSGSNHPAASGPLDKTIEEMAIMRSQQILETLGQSSDPIDSLRAATLEALLFARLFEVGSRRSIYSDRLIDLLRSQGLEVPAKQAFQASVIGGLRDNGIVIAGTSDGYRLAVTTADITDYLAHTEGIVEPMLARVVCARAAVKQDTASRYDILKDGHDVLRAIVGSYTDAKVDTAALTTAFDQHISRHDDDDTDV